MTEIRLKHGHVLLRISREHLIMEKKKTTIIHFSNIFFRNFELKNNNKNMFIRAFLVANSADCLLRIHFHSSKQLNINIRIQTLFPIVYFR